ncbi:MAG: UvrD-helicase domain-containing protein [Marmoricola sp.]
MRIETPADLQRLMQADYPLSEQQWVAVTAPLRPTVVIAGAGSGKTTLMAARVVYLVATGAVRPDEILGLTFTTKAAAELRQRVLTSLMTAGLIPPPGAAAEDEVLEPQVSTYNAYAAELIREHGLRVGHEPDTRVLTDASRYQLGARAVERYRGDIQYLTDHPPTAVQNLLALDGSMAEHLVSAADVRRVDQEARRAFELAVAEEVAGKNRKTYVGPPAAAINAIDRRDELLGLVESYRKLKADLGLMDFSDQIALGARLAEDFPEVGAHERSRFAVVLLDEYQDTSVAQTRLLSALFSGPDADHGRGHPVMAVGDPNQAIYGWRGAAASNIVSFAEAFPALDGPVEVLPLTVNRRSHRRILQVANNLAAPLYEALDAVRPLESPADVGDGVVETHVFESQAEELAWLCEAIRTDHHAGVRWSKIAVLTRDNDSGAACFDALSTAGIPVEIVGLAGLLRLPEVAEVVACLTLMQDPLANASLVTLLSGARWSVGPRDLTLLGARAKELARQHTAGAEQPTSDEDALVEIADGLDPAEIPALIDALEDPGEAPYSDRARQVFAAVQSELRTLRRSVGEPLLDIVRRVIDMTGLDLELASATTPAAEARRENLDLFVKSVAEFQSIDGDVSLTALLAYLTAEDDQGNGLDLAVPSEAESVKLLTVHRSKGLEWDSVFVACAGKTRFPSERGRTLWTSSPAILPAPLRGDAADLPQLQGYDKAAIDAYRAATKKHEAGEERRLGYVALTRAAHHLCFTSHVWGERASAFGPSDYQRVVKESTDRWGVQAHWVEAPEGKVPNPTLVDVATPSWPPPAGAEEARRRREAAALVAAADGDDSTLDIPQAALAATWDAEIDRLVEERLAERTHEIDIELPTSLSATALVRLREDAEGFTRDLARPMPRPPSPQARLGTRFHAWVESRFGQLDLLDPDDLPGRGDVGIEDEADLESLIAAFESGPFRERVPVAVEAPFSLVLGGHIVRGRIDAVYADGDRFLVIDWKTSRSNTADPVQLAIYRLAWAQLRRLDPDDVRAAFYYVRFGLVEEPDLLTEAELERALTG